MKLNYNIYKLKPFEEAVFKPIESVDLREGGKRRELLCSFQLGRR